MTGFFIEPLIMSVAAHLIFKSSQPAPTSSQLSCPFLSHEGKQKGEGKRGQSSLFALLLISRK
jgi:hypothetical protein